MATIRVPCTSLRRPLTIAIGALVTALAMLGAGCRDDGNDAYEPAAEDPTDTIESAVGDAGAASEGDATGASSDSQSPATTDPGTETQAPTRTSAPDTGTEPPTGTDAAGSSGVPTTESAEPPASTAAPTTTGPAIDAATQAFCDAFVTAETTFVRGPDVDVATATAEEIAAATAAHATALDPLLSASVAAAPAAIAPDVTTVTDLVRSSLATAADVASDPDYRAADERVDVFIADSCGYDTIAVSAVEYAFENLPTSVAAGRTSFVFTNNGAEIHEMVVFRIDDDVTETIGEILALEDDASSKVQFIGSTVGAQGETDTETLELIPGRYAALCFIPVGTTDATSSGEGEEPPGPPHFAVGMTAEFTVT